MHAWTLAMLFLDFYQQINLYKTFFLLRTLSLLTVTSEETFQFLEHIIELIDKKEIFGPNEVPGYTESFKCSKLWAGIFLKNEHLQSIRIK